MSVRALVSLRDLRLPLKRKLLRARQPLCLILNTKEYNRMQGILMNIARELTLACKICIYIVYVLFNYSFNRKLLWNYSSGK